VIYGGLSLPASAVSVRALMVRVQKLVVAFFFGTAWRNTGTALSATGLLIPVGRKRGQLE